MSTRWRIFLAAVVLVVVPAGLLAGFFRTRLRDTVTGEFVGRWRTETTRQHDAVGAVALKTARQLAQLAEASRDDNRLRLALLDGRPDLAPFLRDHAGRMARIAQLEVLALVADDGEILSSAHHRNEFGTFDTGLLRALESLERMPVDAGPWLECPEFRDHEWLDVWHSLPEHAAFTIEHTAHDHRLALVNSQPFQLGQQTFTWIGGQYAELPDAVLVVADTLLEPHRDPLDPRHLDEPHLDRWGDQHDRAWLALAVPAVVDGELRPAGLVAYSSRDGMTTQLRQLDQFIATVVLAVLAGAFILAAWLSGRLSRPLASLAHQAEHIDLDDPAADFQTDRGDEVGQLARVLQTMVTRLRAHAQRLAQAEHRATLGELARQVNHDLRNGITPVRNVLRHLGETADQDPARLPDIFARRRGTLDSSLAYLEDLAGRYARLAPESRREPCDLAALAHEMTAAQPQVELRADPDAPRVMADPVSLRRILGNLVRNALEALPDGCGRVGIEVAVDHDPDLGPQCVLTVTDDGVGMPPEVRDHVLEDFFTTKAGGSGLGLSNVRRLAGDAGGRIAITSEPGHGTTITITFPGAENES